MSLKVGDTIPNIELRTMTDKGIEKINLKERSKGKKIVVFALPGAFTPVCSATHLPGYAKKAKEFHNKGVSEIFCLSVNDPFVMDAWRRHQNVKDEVIMAADGNGDFTKAAGLEVDASSNGLGLRSKRYVMIIEDGVVKNLVLENKDDKECKLSFAEDTLTLL